MQGGELAEWWIKAGIILSGTHILAFIIGLIIGGVFV